MNILAFNKIIGKRYNKLNGRTYIKHTHIQTRKLEKSIGKFSTEYVENKNRIEIILVFG